MSHFGDLLRKARQCAGFTQKELGEKVGVDDSYISRLERGVYQPPTREVVLKLADALGISGKIRRFVFFLAAYVAGYEDMEGLTLVEEGNDQVLGQGQQAGTTPTPQPRRMEKERVIQDILGVLNRAEVYEKVWQETLELLESFVEWLKFRLEEQREIGALAEQDQQLSFAQRLYLHITGPASEVQSFFDEVGAGKHDDLKVARAPREYTNMFARHTMGYEARLYGTVVFTAPVAEKLAHDYVKRLIEPRLPQSSIEVKVSEDIPSL